MNHWATLVHCVEMAGQGIYLCKAITDASLTISTMIVIYLNTRSVHKRVTILHIGLYCSMLVGFRRFLFGEEC